MITSPANKNSISNNLLLSYDLTSTVWGLSCPRPICCAVSGGQA